MFLCVFMIVYGVVVSVVCSVFLLFVEYVLYVLSGVLCCGGIVVYDVCVVDVMLCVVLLS